MVQIAVLSNKGSNSALNFIIQHTPLVFPEQEKRANIMID